MEEIRKNLDNIRSVHLVELEGSDFEIEEGMADIIDWEITDSTGLIIGKVRDLLIDPVARKVRYLITIFEGDDQEVLVPIGKVQLDEAQNIAIIQDLTFRQLRGLPVYIKDNLTYEDEYAIQHLFQYYENKKLETEKGERIYNMDTFYDSGYFNEDHFYKKP